MTTETTVTTETTGTTENDIKKAILKLQEAMGREMRKECKALADLAGAVHELTALTFDLGNAMRRICKILESEGIHASDEFDNDTH